ncbi:hypothetical protein JXA47_08520 [Candidatus Sumerlaeota bacterium]|nr:hypothetical protein [Candidatus Sumerlaeota bacterium]
MEIRAGRYTHFILTVIAALLLALVMQVSVGLVTEARAQGPEAAMASPEASVTDALLAIAEAIDDVAEGLEEVARSNESVAAAIRDLEVSVTVENEIPDITPR